MDFSIAGILLLDGATNGAIYALIAMSLVLLFAVTRVIYIPQGEYVAFAALTLGLFQIGQVPGRVWFLLGMAAIAAVLDVWEGVRAREPAGRVAVRALLQLAYPVAVSALAIWLAPLKPPLIVQAL